MNMLGAPKYTVNSKRLAPLADSREAAARSAGRGARISDATRGCLHRARAACTTVVLALAGGRRRARLTLPPGCTARRSNVHIG
jgi:hypothetical protein